MSKKDYVMIAEAISTEYSKAEYDLERYAIRSVTNALALALAVENPRFDRERFLIAALPSV